MAWYAALAAAGASALGGILNYQQSNKWQTKSYNTYLDSTYNAIYNRVQDAKRSGIHPLYALGATAQGAAFQAMPSDALGNGLSNAANILATYADQKDQRELLRAQIESVQLQNKQRELEIEAYHQSKASQTAQSVVSSNKSPFLVSNQSKTNSFDASSRGVSGLDKKVEQMFQSYQYDDGSFDFKPNQQLIDMISDDLKEKAVFYNRSMNKFSDDNWEFWHNVTERLTSKLHREKQLPKNYIVVVDFDVRRGGFFARLKKINSSMDYIDIPFMEWKRSKSYKFLNTPF